MPTMRSRWFLVLPTLSLAACNALQEPQRAAATPQRPTVASDAWTTAERTFEIEGGIEVDDDGGFQSPTAIKYGLGSHTDLTLSWRPWNVVPLPGPDGEGPGDVGVGVKHRVVDGDTDWPDIAILAGATLPTGSRTEGLGSGTNDVFLGGTGTWTWPRGTVLTAFYQMGILGEPAGGVDIQSVFAAALSAPIDDEWSAFGELALDSINARNRNAVFTTGGVAWAAYDHTVFDAGVRIGLNDDATDFGLFVGCTHNLGELFRR